MNAVRIGVALLLLCGFGSASAQETSEKLELCMSCHGETGHPEMKGIPALAGRPADELAEQLKLFRSGQRQNAQMVMTKRLSDGEIRDLAAYFSKQTTD